MKAKRFIKIFVIFSFVLIPIVAYILFSIHSRNLFHAAVAEGDLDTLKSMLARQPKLVNTKNKEGDYALISAVISDYNEITRFLIRKGAQINVQSESRLTPGYTALHWAAYKGNKDLADLLTANGAQVNIQSKDGQTPLHKAAEKGHYDVAKLLIDIGANVNATTKEGKSTPLHNAAYEGHKDVAKLLAARGANVLKRDYRGETSLLVATGRGHTDVAWVLIPYYERYGDFSRLKKTIYEGKLERLKTATEVGFSNIVESILSENPELVNVKDESSRTLLELAVLEGHANVVEVLIAKGANINSISKGGYTHLHTAILLGHKDIGALLLDNGVDVNVRNSKGDTPLHLAVKYHGYEGIYSEYKAKDMIKFLTANRADVNGKNNDGETPLHVATCINRVRVAKLLIESGAHLSEKSNKGTTPLDLARSHQFKEIIELLRNHGAAK